jgi:hypothetical protein
MFRDSWTRGRRETRLQDVTGLEGVLRTRAENGLGRPLTTIFGQVTVGRIAYRAPGAGERAPS